MTIIIVIINIIKILLCKLIINFYYYVDIGKITIVSKTDISSYITFIS